MEESKLREYIKKFIQEILDDEEELEEAGGVTLTGDVEGYNTPFAFTGKSKNSKKKKKRISTNSTDFKVVKEALDKKDLEVIKKIIRDVVGDIYRDIWLKRNAWK